MATRSRLGRDPLSDVAKPAAKKNKTPAKSKAGAKSPAKRQTAKQPQAAPEPSVSLEATTTPASQETAVDVMSTSLPDAVAPAL